MIRSRAKITSIAVAEAHVSRAVDAIRNAGLTGVFTGKTDEHLQGWITMLDRLRKDMAKEIKKR